jgi:hypothetical protein
MSSIDFKEVPESLRVLAEKYPDVYKKIQNREITATSCSSPQDRQDGASGDVHFGVIVNKGDDEAKIADGIKDAGPFAKNVTINFFGHTDCKSIQHRNWEDVPLTKTAAVLEDIAKVSGDVEPSTFEKKSKITTWEKDALKKKLGHPSQSKPMAAFVCGKASAQEVFSGIRINGEPHSIAEVNLPRSEVEEKDLCKLSDAVEQVYDAQRVEPENVSSDKGRTSVYFMGTSNNMAVLVDNIRSLQR